LAKKERQGNENIARNQPTRACTFLRSASVIVPANATHTHGQAVDGAYSIEPQQALQDPGQFPSKSS